jgi:hypothetical protein
LALGWRWGRIGIGADHQIADVEVDVVVGRTVNVHVDQNGNTGGVYHGESGLLLALAAGPVLGALTGVEMATQLEPPVQAAVTVEQHPAGTDDHGGCSDVGRRGVTIERARERAQAFQHERSRALLTGVSGDMGVDGGRQTVDLGIARPSPGGAVIAGGTHR